MRIRDPRHPATFLALIVGTFLVARFVAIGVHEVLGHGLFALALGGSFYGVYVSPVTGFALVFVPGASPPAYAAVALAGIFVDLLLGLLIFLLYPRTRTFVGRLLALAALETFLVYSFVYVAVGAWAVPGGDPEQAALVLGAPHLAMSFTLVGTVWSFVAGFVITREMLAVVRPEQGVGNEIAYIILFWFPPLPLSAIPNISKATSAPVTLLAFFLLTGLVIATVTLAARRVQRQGASRSTSDRSTGPIASLAIAVTLVIPAWGFFGPTGEAANNILLAEPPLAAEGAWASPQALNLRVHLAANREVHLEFLMKGVRTPGSPLEARVLDSYEGRADLASWSTLARTLASRITNVTAWNVTSARIDGTATVWFQGGEHGNPRAVDLAVPDPAFQSLLRDVATVGNRTNITVTVYDPFRANRLDCAACFVDEVNFTWPSSGAPPDPYVLVRSVGVGGTAEARSGFDSSAGLAYVRFRNVNAAGAPAVYQVILEAP